MNFNKFFRCCFPKKEEQIISKKEELYNINYNSDEKLVMLTSTISNIENGKKKVPIEGPMTELQNKRDFIYDKKEFNSTKSKIESSLYYLKEISKRKERIKNEISNNNNNQFNTSGFTQESININNHSNISAVSNVNKNKKEDDSALDQLYSSRIFSEEQVKNANQLLLEELQGDILGGKTLKITAAGITKGLRKVRDGVSFFGKSNKQVNNSVINDFELNIENGINLGPHVFIIYYKKESKKYYLKAYRDKTHNGYVHIKIENQKEFPIIKKEIIILSETYFQVTLLPNSKLEIINLGANNDYHNKELEREFRIQKYYFEPNDYKSVTIGRDNSCTISFPEEKLFSKIHATLNFDYENKIWKLRDGSYEKPSTNGTWIYATHSYEVNDNMVFQVGNSQLRLSVQT